MAALTSDVENGKIEWSNELVAHVVELKTNGPTADLETLDDLFAENIREMNSLLKEFDSELITYGCTSFDASRNRNAAVAA